MDQKPDVVAFYLPQYHPIPENDAWWGKGFTEWTNVTKAKPLYKGHHQPDLPSDLGFYDLRVSETRKEQADLAQKFGVNVFCYYHYWFGDGKRLLHRPFDEVLRGGEPDIKFMLCWANQSWTGVWHGLDRKVLIEQKYSGMDDEEKHFKYLFSAFSDPRYYRIEDKPVFMFFEALGMPEPKDYIERMRGMARAHGLKGLYLIAQKSEADWDYRRFGYDAFVHLPYFHLHRPVVSWANPVKKIANKWDLIRKIPRRYDYNKMSKYLIPDVAQDGAIPVVMPNWDNTPRSGSRGAVFENSNPVNFGLALDRALRRVKLRNHTDNMLFIKSWNEWAEGNYLEPSRRYGDGYLRALRESLIKNFE